MKRADGYLILGELNLREGDLLEARRSFAAAASRARGETRCAALAGSAQVAWLAGDLDGARSFYEQALREDATDPLNLRPAFVEVLLCGGDLASAGRELGRCEDDSADFHLLSALLHRRRGDLENAVTSVRRACLANVYLPFALAGDEPPALGLVHGVEEATPEHAAALVERLLPLLAKDRGAAPFLVAAATIPMARREREDLVRIARALPSAGNEARRRELKRELSALRDPARIAAGARAAAGEIGPMPQPGSGPPCSFDV
jgi:hypothetical protein